METMSKIFLMEFIVDDVRLWKLPQDVIESDPARLVFTYLDSVCVEIDKHEFDMAGQNAGKNCLFTSDRRPTFETPIKITVFKKALEEALIKVGAGKIQIEETFMNLFRVSLPEMKPEGEDIPDTPSNTSDPVEFPITEVHKAWFPIIEALPDEKELNITDEVSPENDSSQSITQIGVVLVRLRITCFGSNMVAPLQYDKKKRTTNKCPAECKSTTRCSQIFLPIIGKSPASKNSNNNTEPCMKLPFICPPSETRRWKKEHRDRNQKKRQVQKYIESNQCSEKVPNICVCDPPGIYINNTTFDADNTNVAKEEFLLVPPASTMDFGIPKPAFDEYRTAIDENELIVRVTKNTRTVCQISKVPNVDFQLCPEGETSLEPGHCPNPNQLNRFNYPKQYTMTVEDDGNDMMVCMPTKNGKYINSCGIPLIRGNLKYPPRFETSYKLPQCADVNPVYRPVISKPRNLCMKCEGNKKTDLFGNSAMCPDGIEVCKKSSPNPNFDVFVLKLAGPKDGDINPSTDQIELELRTPKSPTAPAIQETIEVQTYEEDFDEPYVVGAQITKGGKEKKESKKDKGKKDKDSPKGEPSDKKEKKGKKK